MPEFNSPLGRRQFAMDQAAKKQVLTVPDEEMDRPQTNVDLTPGKKLNQEQLDQLDAMRKERQMATKHISPIAKERIEYLIGLGRVKKDVPVDDVVFSLQSLKDEEVEEILLAASGATTQLGSYFATRRETLARSIYQVDGQPISLVLGGSGPEVVRDLLLKSMDDAVIEFLHNKYLEMKEEQQKKYGIKNDSDIKEVVEDVKKS